MKRALIIGGSGGLSSVVAKIAIETGYEVSAVTRGKRQLPDNVISIIADRNSGENLKNAILAENKKWDVAFDCICMNSDNAKQDLEILPKVTKRLVVVSTDSVYDPYNKKTPQTEDGIFIEEEGSDDVVSYGCNKRRMEKVFMEDMNSATPKMNTTIFRPGHIYGPGFLLGCFPENSRQKELIDIIDSNQPVRLVGMGTYLIHPIYVDDLARVMVECVENENTYNQIFCIGGPQAVENRFYYECIAKVLGKELNIEEVPLKGYLENHPEFSGHLCHRIYDLTKLKSTGIHLPDTQLENGIRKHINYIRAI